MTTKIMSFNQFNRFVETRLIASSQELSPPAVFDRLLLDAYVLVFADPNSTTNIAPIQ
ncbi:hypothetical protein Cylst_1094 [Cylindrospermum stagnale PCC 7417]|uniref:Uncharacterized protein n=1 Tax=Cylindrospermum stagnale PCC 7417 TaxID=56107 RepID=K9WUE0_9NOST|nr:hypothetical protein [Cylindrospermum stagnale]AFZ23406.1 hypothetical protein Cylst_1094 [Cylindrospermum stagnale PCC 7417]